MTTASLPTEGQCMDVMDRISLRSLSGDFTRVLRASVAARAYSHPDPMAMYPLVERSREKSS